MSRIFEKETGISADIQDAKKSTNNWSSIQDGQKHKLENSFELNYCHCISSSGKLVLLQLRLCKNIFRKERRIRREDWRSKRRMLYIRYVYVCIEIVLSTRIWCYGIQGYHKHGILYMSTKLILTARKDIVKAIIYIWYGLNVPKRWIISFFGTWKVLVRRDEDWKLPLVRYHIHRFPKRKTKIILFISLIHNWSFLSTLYFFVWAPPRYLL